MSEMQTARVKTVGPLLAQGRTADVHAWGDHQVIKLFQPWADKEMVSREQRIAKGVFEAGVFTPEVGEIITIEDRWGLIFERVEAESMLHALRNRPLKAARLARQFADLQLAMHAQKAEGLPSWKNRLANNIQRAKPLPGQLKELALKALNSLPDGNSVCHGDFHPDNVLMTSKGPMVIDWIDAAAGPPIADVTRTVLMTRYGALPKNPQMRVIIQFLRYLFNRSYMQHYFAGSRLDKRLIASWLPVLAAARLNEGIEQEEANLIKLVEDGLCRMELK